MIVIIPINGDNLKSSINRSFGRTKQFMFVDTGTLAYKIVDNEQNLQAAQGAGIQSAQLAVKSGTDAVITIHCGPKAYKVLNSAGVKVFIGKVGSIQENIDAFINAKLEEMTDSNVEGHWV